MREHLKRNWKRYAALGAGAAAAYYGGPVTRDWVMAYIGPWAGM